MNKSILLASCMTLGVVVCFATDLPTDPLDEKTSPAINLDTLTKPRSPADTENIVLPAAWGADATGLKCTITSAEAGDSEMAGLTPTTSNVTWQTAQSMPGRYTLTLNYGDGEDHESAVFVIDDTGSAVTEAATFLDNAYDADVSGLADVRDIANHTNEFRLAWAGQSGSPVLTLDGDDLQAEPDANGNWLWETNGLTYALYTFTNKVDGVDNVARFRVNAKDIAVHFHADTNDVLVARTWQYLPTAAKDASRKALSDLLKTNGENGYAFWKNYVLGLDPSKSIDMAKSNISVENVAENQVKVTVWPVSTQTPSVIEGANATVVYTIDYTDSLDGTPSWTVVKQIVEKGDVKYTETIDKTKRFYRTDLDVQPTAK